MKKTKIVATVGPSTERPEIIEKLIEVGVDVFRFNFSHGTHEKHLELLKRIRNIAKQKNRYIAALMDLSGPKLRLGEIKEPVPVRIGEVVKIVYGDFIGDEKIIPLPIKEVFETIKVDDHFYIADGTVKLRVLEKGKDYIISEILSAGIISSRKGLNLPNVDLKLSALTEKDKDDIKFGIKAGFDIIALSFVRTKDDVLLAKKIIEENGGDIPVFAKIEKNEAITNIDEIIEISDGVMVARGDLGIEIDMEKVPVVQKMIIKKANETAKPVITATQMLTSMIKHSRPTRAEVSDIANAVLDGTDAVMLSDETTIGDFPVEAVKVMVKTIEETERIYPYYKFYDSHDQRKISSAIAQTAVKLAKELRANGIVAFTKSGASARRVSKSRPECPIYAVATDEKVLRQLAISWGVTHYMISKDTDNADELLIEFLKKTSKDFRPDHVFIATIGYPAGVPGSTNVIRTIRKQDYDYFLT
ncbi:pyruvate kinase [Deferribacter autotrophicus]|uniref:Pyruvate kinase n=1 Tax=Deferribacter autotrophicus TaxID=500465 RepID=A0A5A8F1X1_9BACT|nr:pyruvate kinase [Deferribacter autotrophicus]KAA0257392.1 pyruvate kinase [Deferribacter autotrophicus]